jgi:peptidoglycan-associated lipoprotein
MSRKGFVVLVVLVCVGLLFISFGCAKKSTVKQDPSMNSAQELAAERERARLREEEAARKREQELKEFEKSLMAKRTPGIEGEVYESKLLKRVHFDFDEYTIRSSDVEILKDNAAVLRKLPTLKIQIEGHCDERGTTEYNIALGERRANSARQYLISSGIEPGRISIISYGEERPLIQGQGEEVWSKNRRADFLVVSK